jgi:cytochrome b subunit of formate dehydrogenase
MYRNIDEDIRLFNMSKRYWNEKQLTKEQVHWILGAEGYSNTEIENALNDYYNVHVRGDIFWHNFIAPIILILVMIGLVIKIYTLLQ